MVEVQVVEALVTVVVEVQELPDKEIQVVRVVIMDKQVVVEEKVVVVPLAQHRASQVVQVVQVVHGQ